MRRRKYYFGKARCGKKRRVFPPELYNNKGHVMSGSFTKAMFKKAVDEFLSSIDPLSAEQYIELTNKYPTTIILPDPSVGNDNVVDMVRWRNKQRRDLYIHGPNGEVVPPMENSFNHYHDTMVDWGFHPSPDVVWRMEAMWIIYRWSLRKKAKWRRYKPMLVIEDIYPYVILIDKKTGKKAPRNILSFNRKVLAIQRLDEDIAQQLEDEGIYIE